MVRKKLIIKKIIEAFTDTEYPGDWCLRGSNLGDEPFLVENEFKGKTDWKTIDCEFLNQAPNGLGSALSFFSDEAFRFYLPAYLIADLDGKLPDIDVLFHLCHTFDNNSKSELINRRGYGMRTWYDEGVYQFTMFTRREVEAIFDYLKYKLERTETESRDKQLIKEALENYWINRLKTSTD